MSDNDALWTVLVILGFLLMLGAVAAATLPGTLELDEVINSGEPEPRYDLTTKIGVEGTVTGAKINEDSYRQDITRSGLFSFSVIGPDADRLSLIGAQNVEMRMTLTGPIDTPIQVTRTLGDLTAACTIGQDCQDSATVTFKATKLPAGTYTLDYEIFWEDGSTDYQREIVIPEGDV